MKLKLRAFLLLGCALLVACGGGDAEIRGTISVVPGITGNIGPGVATDGAGNLFYSSGNTVLKRS